MLGAFARALRTPDLRKKILFTLGIIVRVTGWVLRSPSPGRLDGDHSRVPQARPPTTRSTRCSTCSPVEHCCSCRSSRSASCPTSPQLDHRAAADRGDPALGAAQEGRPGSGQAKLTQYTRYLTIALGILQATGIVALAPQRRPVPLLRRRVTDHPGPASIFRIVILVVTMTAGTAVGHVDGRAGHRPRHRQRHVPADLHLDRRPDPGRGQESILQARRRQSSLSCSLLGLAIIAAWCSSSRVSDASRCSTPSA